MLVARQRPHPSHDGVEVRRCQTPAIHAHVQRLVRARKRPVRVAVEHQRAVVALVRNNVNYSNYNGAAGTGLFFVSYDPSTDVLTSSFLNSLTNAPFATPTYSSASGVDGCAHIKFSDIPNSVNKLMYMVGGNSSTFNNTRTASSSSSPRIIWAVVLSPSGSIVSTVSLTGNPTTNYSAETPFITTLLPMGDNKYLGFTDARSFLYHDGTQWSSNRAIFAASGSEGVVTGAYRIDDTYCAITFCAPIDGTVSGSTRAAKNAIAQNQYLRIVRFVDANFAEVSPATETYANFALGVPLNIEGNFIDKIGTNTLAYYSKASATGTDARINIRSIFGA